MQIKLEKQRSAILLTAEGRTTTNKIKKKGEGRIFSKAFDLVQSLKFPHFESLFILCYTEYLLVFRFLYQFISFYTSCFQYVAGASNMDKEHSNQEMLLVHHSLEITVTVGQYYGMSAKG